MSENKNKITEIVQTIIITETLDENNLAFIESYFKLGKEKILDNEEKLIEDVRFGEIIEFGGELSLTKRFNTYRTINKVEDLEVNKYMEVVDTKIIENTTNITEYIYDNLAHYYLTLMSKHKMTFLEMNEQNLINVYNDMMKFIKSFKDLKYNAYEALLCLDIRIQYEIDIFDYKTELIDDIKINTDNIQFSIYQLLKYNFNNYYYSIYNALTLESEDYPVTPLIEKILKNNEYYFILILFYIKYPEDIKFEDDIVTRISTFKKLDKYGFFDYAYLLSEVEKFIKNFKNIIYNTKEIIEKKQFSTIELHYHILDEIEENNEIEKVDENIILSIMSNMILEIGKNAFNKIISIKNFLENQEYIEFLIFSQFIYNDLVPVQLMKNKEIIKLKQNQIIFDSLKEDFKVYNFVDYILMKSPLGVKLNIYNSNLNIINEIDNLSEINIEFSLTFLNDYDDFFKKIFEKSQDIRKKKYENSINQEEFNYTDRENINQKKKLKNDYGVLIKTIKSLKNLDESTIKIFENIFGFNYIYTTKSNLPRNINQNINVNKINDYVNYFREINKKITYEDQKGKKLKFDNNTIKKKSFDEILEKNYPDLIPILDFEEFDGTYIKNEYINNNNILKLLENIKDSIPDINNEKINIKHYFIIYNIIDDGFLNINDFSNLNTRYSTKYNFLDTQSKIEMDVEKQINYIFKYLYSTERFSNLDKYYYKLILFNNLYVLFNNGRFPIEEDVVVECINNNTFNFGNIENIFPIFLKKENVKLLENEIKEISLLYINHISNIKIDYVPISDIKSGNKPTDTIINKIKNYILTIGNYKTYVDHIEFIITRLPDEQMLFKKKTKEIVKRHRTEYITYINKSYNGLFKTKMKSTIELISDFNKFINGNNSETNFRITKELSKLSTIQSNITQSPYFESYYEDKIKDILLIPNISLSPIDKRYESLIHLNEILKINNLELDTSLNSRYIVPNLDLGFCNTFKEENINTIIENYLEEKTKFDFKENLILYPKNIIIAVDARKFRLEYESKNVVLFNMIDNNEKNHFLQAFNKFI